MSTIETAIASAALIIVAAAMCGGIVSVAAQLAAIDNAGAAARAHAIGVEFVATRGTIDFTESGGLVTATARVPSPLGTRTATAIFPKEQP
ncbi:hypothetical protein AY498_05895 [Corynebacterium ulcerans]|uniref:Secreted protein n=2 Tax=Corynebacterium ulcerans TaxID=65058 RepID=A0ABD7MU21_CORUL|nr:hypothetical protein [Corynebacterium ulcerans]AEG80805.1 putative secreted protein [Corynebacterium ulcerans 809]AEG82984.1 putative secreted protein [Corynebacterium ulcerans BR-AD22]AIU29635.1 Hypothetical protein Cul210931_0269 [Corynebacterium ulcerans]AKN76130.1 Hypothetical protein CulFRC58_0276 [Corynebacterium ulcerans FRC58]MBH5295167.1 hypothetical protein [Corynebacterium ulcerans]